MTTVAIFCLECRREPQPEGGGKHGKRQGGGGKLPNANEHMVIEVRLVDSAARRSTAALAALADADPDDAGGAAAAALQGNSAVGGTSGGNNAPESTIAPHPDALTAPAQGLAREAAARGGRGGGGGGGGGASVSPVLLERGFSAMRRRPESLLAVNPAAGTLLGSVVLHTDVSARACLCSGVQLVHFICPNT